MRKAVLILACLFLVASVSSSQRKPKPKADPLTELTRPRGVSPCGVPIPSFEEFVEEQRIEWRVVSATKETLYFYNTHRVTCGSGGILSAWVKGTYDNEAKSISDMTRYEFKCRLNHLRITSQAEYYKDGSVKSSRTYKNAEWDEVIPDSVGESILEGICRKKV
jgi:hypothetical protein